MSGRVAPLLLAGLLAGCTAGGSGIAASCVGPSMTLTPTAAAVGEDVTVAVEWLREGCNDYSGADEERPLTDVPVTFVQDGARVPLGTVGGTGERYAGRLTAPVPQQAVPGAAAVVLGEGEAVTADLVVLP